MRNLKKILALALVFAMAFTFTAGAASFTDAADIGANYVDDVNMLVELGVIAGYPDGSFGPKNNITRAEFAKMAYTLKYGSDTDGNLFAAQASKFTDVEGNANVAWAKGYINYCANQNIVSGVGNNKFNPQGNITVAEAAKMILVILGCDPAKEGFTGANWMSNVVAKAIDLGIFNGWAGDPSALATRELVAKLMKNAIFSPVYTYSAITGMGSQKNALGTADNETLGEKTMGLKTVTGIVVANERYYIDSVVERGEFYDIEGWTPAETGEDSEEAIIAYEYKNEETNETVRTVMTIDRALDDDMLGNKVNVFFKADKIESNGRIDYKNIEVIGDVLVHSDTVAYTVPAIATDVYPDGDSTSNSTIRPYIGFTVDGAEHKITLDVDKIAKSTDVQDADKNGVHNDMEESVVAEILNYAYILDDDAAIDDDGGLTDADATFVAEMGMPTLSQYRFVSVDGGNTYSYMFKMVEDGVNTLYGAVTSKNASTIRISGDTSESFDIEDVIINGDVAIDDYVVAYRANGKVIINKVEAMNAAVESFGDDDSSVILSGSEYYPWVACDLDERASLFDYYQNTDGSMSASTKYYVYNNLIMEIEPGEGDSFSGDYAVITRSSYNSTLEEAFVNLTFADGTSGSYKIGKLYKAPGSSSLKSDYAEDFTKNAYFGAVVKCKILDDGTVDLSAQNFKSNEFIENYGDGTDIYGEYDDNGNFRATGTKDYTFGISGGKVVVTKEINDVKSTSSYYGKNDDAVIFLLYGNPMYDEDTELPETDDDAYEPVSARAYTISELTDFDAKDIVDFYINSYGETGVQDVLAGHVLFDSNTSKTKSVVAASMTVGTTLPKVKFNTSDALAYIVSAKQYYNAASSKYYAVLNLINEKGDLELYTVESATDNFNTGMLTQETVGSIDGPRDTFPAGSFIRYKLDGDGKIKTVDNDGLGLRDIEKGYNGEQHGFFLVNITGERNGVVTFYDTIYGVDTDIVPAEESVSSLKFHEEDGCDVIAISDEEYSGERVITMSTKETTLKANTGNAILQVEEGQAIRIFSFADGYVYKG